MKLIWRRDEPAETWQCSRCPATFGTFRQLYAHALRKH